MTTTAAGGLPGRPPDALEADQVEVPPHAAASGNPALTFAVLFGLVAVQLTWLAALLYVGYSLLR